MQSLAQGCADSTQLTCNTFPDYCPDFDVLASSGVPDGGGAQPPQPWVAEGDGLKLDTSTLLCNLDRPHRPEITSPSDRSAYRDRPINYPDYLQTWHMRAKVQEFSAGGYEVTIAPLNLARIADQAMRNRRRGARTEQVGDEESQEKSRLRTKRTVRLRCKEMGADHLLTLTTRKTIGLHDLYHVHWKKFYQYMYRKFGRHFAYVAVPERHPTNPNHFHLHLAIRGRLTPRELVVLRRCWYVALGGAETDRGASVRGGVNVKEIRIAGGSHRRMDKIAAYISKYITKQDSVAFNARRYWSSKIDLPAARHYWLKAYTIEDAFIEIYSEYGLRPTRIEQDFFKARSNDLIWFKSVPDPGVVEPVPF